MSRFWKWLRHHLETLGPRVRRAAPSRLRLSRWQSLKDLRLLAVTPFVVPRFRGPLPATVRRASG